MKNKKFNSDVQMEPLVQGWYSWIHMIPPGTFSLNIKNRYLPILSSYAEHPQMHKELVADPAMKGGPFIDFESERVEEIVRLKNKTTAECKAHLELAEAIEGITAMLATNAKGYSLEPLYESIPASMRGLTELYYDLNGQPAFRIFEGLLYKTQYYREDFQSLAFSRIKKDRNRPFILSTPRLSDENTVHTQIPFRSPVIDKLFSSKKNGCNPNEIIEELGLDRNESRLFETFFSDVDYKPYEEYNGKGMRIRYFGHACILIEGRGISILMDPVLSYTYDSEISRLTYDDLPEKIDYVLITHSHQDHILLETMLQIRSRIGCIMIARNLDGFLVDPSLKLALQMVGFKNIRELYEMEEVEIPGGSITGIPFLGEHHDLPIHSKICYLVKIKEFSFLAMADATNIDDSLYERVRSYTSNVDALFIGMECDGSPPSWVYGPLLPFKVSREMDYSRRGRGCNFNEARKIVERFGCREVYVYAMGLEPWLKHILNLEYTEQSNPIIQARKLLEYCNGKGIVAEMLFGEKEILLEKQ
jgi:L-ascorbate metabolism protein UlaG (beta-lactamase superfamily)